MVQLLVSDQTAFPFQWQLVAECWAEKSPLGISHACIAICISQIFSNAFLTYFQMYLSDIFKIISTCISISMAIGCGVLGREKPPWDTRLARDFPLLYCIAKCISQTFSHAFFLGNMYLSDSFTCISIVVGCRVSVS